MLFSEGNDINYRAIKDYFIARNQSKRFHSQRANALEESFAKRQENKDLEKIVTIFKSLIHLWKYTVEKNGGKFYIVLLPRYEEHLSNSLISEEFNIIDLFELFGNDIESSNRLNWRFKNDGHWNEAGNQLAAVHLYQFLEKEAHLSPLSMDDLKEEIYAYYSAFPGVWMPDMWVKKVAVPPEKSTRIRAKYTAIEMMSIGP